ncbi:UDP-glucuronic acid decarboxylase 6 isoform X1 [Canna indica]|uniref:UDP-glucuronic acid decarboxylase 1 n=1 Tax=Canna indica TaxID=4628 RepID=A0AAQ3KGW5_9LILI|nr:UDP-glucuronic acid decarboxylase 6 isoform X1 [Canna indica]
MAKETANGDRNTSTRPPPLPSPIRFSKFFQSNLRILVTGGAGFIGSHLVDKLMENEKKEVIVVDNYFTGSKDNLKKWIGHPRFELIRHDVTEPLLVEVDQIYHLACPASPIFYKYNPVKTIKTNVIGTLNMLGLAKRVGARILLTSTSEVYGDPLEHPQTEEYWGNVNPIGVRSCYDEGKRVAETLMFDYHRQHGLEIRIARIFNTYGPRMNIDDGRVVSNFIAQAIRILLTSTSEVYGDPLEHPQTEEYWGNVNPIGVRSCYDEGKRVAETLMFDYHRQHGLEIRIARIFNTYGPRMNIDDGRVVSNFIAQAIRGEPLTVQAPGTQTRSFCYVSDMVDGLIRLMEGDNTGPINIGNPGEFTMMELAEAVKELIDPAVPVKIVDNTPDDPRQRKPDITKAKELLGWKPTVTLREGLPLMEEDFRQRLGVPKKQAN